MSALKRFFGLIKQSYNEWSEDKATKLSAALAYYTMLSLAPLLIISIKIVGMIFGQEAASGQVQNYMRSTVGTKGAAAAQEMIKHAGQSGSGVLATTVSIIILIFSASGVFGELQDSLNTIWEVRPKPGRGIMGIIKDRFFSFTLVLGVVFLLLVSLVISTVLAGVTRFLGDGQNFFFQSVNFVISIGVITVLFALIFKYLPDATVRWRSVWYGAILTAILFTIGKFILGWYLGRGSTTSVYGAAGSLVALLIWVYYSAQILFFGAEFTQVYAKSHGHAIAPTANAMAMTEAERAQRGVPHKETVQAAAKMHAAGASVARPTGVPVDSGHVIQLPPSVPQLRRKKWTFGGAGLVLGAAAGAVGTYLAERQSATRTKPRRRDLAATLLDERLKRVEDKVGEVKHFEREVRARRVYDQVRAIGDRLVQYERRSRHPEPVYRDWGHEFMEGFREGYHEHEDEG